MFFPEQLRLENDRALLRPLEMDDVANLNHFTTEQPNIWKYSINSPATSIGMAGYIKQTIQQRDQKKEYPLILFDKKTNQYAGCSRFYDIQLDNSTTQLGYTWYGNSFQRTGFNRHCKLLMLSFAFEEWGMERVEFRADVKNEASVNAMKNIGCQVEGLLRSQSPAAEGGRRDTIVLSIIKDQWFHGGKDLLLSKIH